MPKVPNAVETLPKISTGSVGCRVYERYRRQTTDGRAIAYSEREREFTIANKQLYLQQSQCAPADQLVPSSFRGSPH